MPITVASINVNGLRAAARKGMKAWFERCDPDVITMQEVRAPDELVEPLVAEVCGDEWSVVHHPAVTAGRAGVAVASRLPIGEHRNGGRVKAFSTGGRWIEADVSTPSGAVITVVSVYVHTGDETDEAKMAEKHAFLRAMTKRMAALRADGRHVLITGDLNVAHAEIDIKNWRGNLNKAGFLPEERAHLTGWFDRGGWVDVGRRLGGDGPGPYTWWSYRGRAYDNDAGWRIDYQIASPELGAAASRCWVDRSEAYADRWSDHSPVIATYDV